MTEQVSIGGVGGSGTRAVARILELLGYFMGGSLNRSGDNLWFTALLRRPRWYREVCSENLGHEVDQVLETFYRIMSGRTTGRAALSDPSPGH